MPTRSVDSHHDAAAILAAAADRPRFSGRATVGHHTYLTAADDGAIALVYWATAVVTYRPDGTITVDTGGYATATTTARLQRHTPARYRFYRRQRTVYVDDLRSGTTTMMVGPLTLADDRADLVAA